MASVTNINELRAELGKVANRERELRSDLDNTRQLRRNLTHAILKAVEEIGALVKDTNDMLDGEVNIKNATIRTADIKTAQVVHNTAQVVQNTAQVVQNTAQVAQNTVSTATANAARNAAEQTNPRGFYP